MARLATLKEELQERFPTVEAVRAQAPNPNEFAGDVADHKIYEFLSPMVVRLRPALPPLPPLPPLHAAPCRGRLTPCVRRYWSSPS